MTALQSLLDTFRGTAKTEREKGTYFERLVKAYLLNEPYYRDLYAGRVWLWEEWRGDAAKRGAGNVGTDAGIDLVAETTTGELHAIQAKFYDAEAQLTLRELSTFLTAAGRKTFSHGLIFLTATRSTGHLRDALQGQKTPISLVTLHDLEGSQIDWSRYQPGAKPVLKPQKQLRPHQQSALTAVKAGLAAADRGKLIMACGTGKTFVALKIAEELAGKGGRVLFLVPSLALLSQALTEWTQESGIPLHSYAVCSDTWVPHAAPPCAPRRTDSRAATARDIRGNRQRVKAGEPAPDLRDKWPQSVVAVRLHALDCARPTHRKPPGLGNL